MKNFLFDTNVLLYLLRKEARWEQIFETYNLENTFNCLSIVSLGELLSLGMRNSWGKNRLSKIDEIKRDFTILDINYETTIERYAEIDVFSQGKLPLRPLGLSARNMGKNDLWIAATASVFNLSLLTSDNDFDHLHSSFINLVKV